MPEFKDGVNKIAEGLGNVAAFIGNKAGEAVGNAKESIAIANHQVLIDKLYKKIGKYYFDKYTATGQFEKELLEDYKLIETTLKQIETLKED